MSRCLLHKDKLRPFILWCEEAGVPTREGRGTYEVLQVQARAPDWFCIFARHHMPEHFTVDRRLEGLVHRFIQATRKERPHDLLRVHHPDELPLNPVVPQGPASPLRVPLLREEEDDPGDPPAQEEA